MQIAADGWFRTEIPVRFRDLDPMGHAHHTLPLIYLEEARAAFWRELKGTDSLDAIDYVMAEITLRLHARIHFPSSVTVGLAVRRVGSKSFTLVFEIRNDAGGLLASGSAVQVSYDYDRSAAQPINDPDRAALNAWRDAAQNSSATPADTAPINPPST